MVEVEEKFLCVCDEIKKIFSDVAKDYRYKKINNEKFEFEIVVNKFRINEHKDVINDDIISSIFLEYPFKAFLTVYYKVGKHSIEKSKTILFVSKDNRILRDIRYKRTVVDYLKNKKDSILRIIKQLENEFITDLGNLVLDLNIRILCDELKCDIKYSMDLDNIIIINAYYLNYDSKLILQLLSDERFKKLAKELNDLINEYRFLASI